MSATIDCVYLATIAQYKLSTQAGHPSPSLRLLVGHSNLLGTLVPGLVEHGLWSLEIPPQPEPEDQNDGAGVAGSKFTEKFTRCSDGENLDWDSSSDSDDASAYSSDESDDGAEYDNSLDADTGDDVTELSFLEDHLAQLRRRLASRADAACTGSWLTTELGRRHTEEELSMQAPVVVSLEKAIAEISTAPLALIASPSSSSSPHPRHFCLLPRNPRRVAEPSALVPDKASMPAGLANTHPVGGQEVVRQHQARVFCCWRLS